MLAQGINNDLLNQVTKESCDELSKTDLSKKTAEELKIALGFSVVKVVGQHASELAQSGFSFSDSKSVEKVATEIGARLVVSCPVFLDALKRSGAIEEQLRGTSTSASVRGSISGKLVKIVSGEFTYLQIEDAKGKIEKLWWMEYFNGSNKLLTNSQSQLDKPVKVNYVEREVFNSTLNDYVKIKVITGIE
jgi:hypothetical protein